MMPLKMTLALTLLIHVPFTAVLATSSTGRAKMMRAVQLQPPSSSLLADPRATTAILNEIQYPEDNAHQLLRRTQTDAGNETTVDGGTNTDKIVSGTIVSDRNKYPFIAWPEIRSGGSFCDAALVHPDFLLTAAHCQGAFAGKTIYIGGTDIYGSNAQEAIQAVQEFVNPSYNPSVGVQNDFMLVKLQQIATVVAPVTLNTDSNTPSNSGTTATVIDMERQLQQVVYQRHCAKHKSKPPPIVKIYSAELISMYTFVQGQRQAPNHLATAIQGDGMVVGVVSFGATTCDKGYPAVYGRVSSAQKWIKETICGNSTVAPTNCGSNIDVPNDNVPNDNNPSDNNPSDNVSNNNDNCFSGSNSVEVKNKGLIFMHQLQIGDYVKTGIDDQTYSRVYSFAHLDRQAVVAYLQIYVEAAHKPIEMSNQHLLYMGDGTLVPAETVHTGDKLLYQGEQRSVVRIQTIQRRGLYHPITESGDIIVSGVRASTYASVLGMDSKVEAFVTHSVLSPLRLACRLNFAICEKEEYTGEGFSTTINVAIQLAFHISQQTSTLRTLWLIIVAPAVLLMFALGNTFQPWLCLGVCTTVVHFARLKYKK